MKPEDRDSYEHRIKTLKDAAAGLSANLAVVRQQRDAFELELATANAELLRRGSVVHEIA